jgi:hypothetical protein
MAVKSNEGNNLLSDIFTAGETVGYDGYLKLLDIKPAIEKLPDEIEKMALLLHIQAEIIEKAVKVRDERRERATDAANCICFSILCPCFLPCFLCHYLCGGKWIKNGTLHSHLKEGAELCDQILSNGTESKEERG